MLLYMRIQSGELLFCSVQTWRAARGDLDQRARAAHELRRDQLPELARREARVELERHVPQAGNRHRHRDR